MDRLNRGARLGVLIALVLVCAFGVACKKIGSNGEPTNVIDVLGGAGATPGADGTITPETMAP